MKKLLVGVICGWAFLGFAFGAYVFSLYQTAKPGFVVSADSRSRAYSAEERQELVESLIKLSQISDIFGAKRFAALTIGSAGMTMGDQPSDDATQSTLARAYMMRAISLTEQVATKSNNYDPLLEARFSYGLLLRGQGLQAEAKSYLNETLQIAHAKAPQSYWVKNLERAILAVSDKN